MTRIATCCWLQPRSTSLGGLSQFPSIPTIPLVHCKDIVEMIWRLLFPAKKGFARQRHAPTHLDAGHARIHSGGMRLTRKQFLTLSQQVAERLDYLNRLADRVNRTDLIQDARIFELANRARNAVQALADEFHERSQRDDNSVD